MPWVYISLLNEESKSYFITDTINTPRGASLGIKSFGTKIYICSTLKF
jgi:hypothetical protein